MAELIDRQALHRACKSLLESMGYIVDGDGLNANKRCEECETIESLRPQGEWIEAEARSKSTKFICSECAKIAYYPQPTRDRGWIKKCGYNYCPNCGARMKGGTHER